MDNRIYIDTDGVLYKECVGPFENIDTEELKAQDDDIYTWEKQLELCDKDDFIDDTYEGTLTEV